MRNGRKYNFFLFFSFLLNIKIKKLKHVYFNLQGGKFNKSPCKHSGISQYFELTVEQWYQNWSALIWVCLQNILKKFGNYLCFLVTLCLVTKITKSLLNEKCVFNIVKQFWWYVLESWDLWLYENGVTIRFSMNWLRGQFSQFSRYVRLSVFLPVCPIARNRQFCQNG